MSRKSVSKLRLGITLALVVGVFAVLLPVAAQGGGTHLIANFDTSTTDYSVAYGNIVTDAHSNAVQTIEHTIPQPGYPDYTYYESLINVKIEGCSFESYHYDLHGGYNTAGGAYFDVDVRFTDSGGTSINGAWDEHRTPNTSWGTFTTFNYGTATTITGAVWAEFHVWSSLGTHGANLTAIIDDIEFPCNETVETPTPTYTPSVTLTASSTSVVAWVPTRDTRPLCPPSATPNRTNTPRATGAFAVPTFPTVVLMHDTALPSATVLPTMSVTAPPSYTPSRTPNVTVTVNPADCRPRVSDAAGLDALASFAPISVGALECVRLSPETDVSLGSGSVLGLTIPALQFHINELLFCRRELAFNFTVLGISYYQIFLAVFTLKLIQFLIGIITRTM